MFARKDERSNSRDADLASRHIDDDRKLALRFELPADGVEDPAPGVTAFIRTI